MKNINKKIETMFNSNEKYKLFFLRKFLNNLRIECKKEKFPLIENFQENKLILKLKEEEREGYLKIIIISGLEGLVFFLNNSGDPFHILRFKNNKIDNDFLFNTLHNRIFFFTKVLKKIVIEEKIKEYPQNYALKEYFEVINNLPYTLDVQTSFKVSELLKAQSYPKLIEEKTGKKLTKKFRRLPLEFLDFTINSKIEADFLLDCIVKEKEKSLNLLNSFKKIGKNPNLYVYFFAELLGISKKINLNLLRNETKIEEYFEDIANMLYEMEDKNFFKKILKLEKPSDVKKLHDKILKKYIKFNQDKVSKRKLLISKNFENIIESFKKDENLSFLNLIDDEQDLFIEGVVQGNCVHSYTSLIEEGKSIIFSGSYKGTRCTIEITHELSNTFYCRQCYASYNRENSITKELKDIIDIKLSEIKFGTGENYFSNLLENINEFQRYRGYY